MGTMLGRILSWPFRKIREELFPFLGRETVGAMPPKGTIGAVVLLGILVPFVIDVDARQPALVLARERIEGFLAGFLARHRTGPDLIPAGTILAERPAFIWKRPPENADHYRFRLYAGEVVRIDARRLAKPSYDWNTGRLAAVVGGYRFVFEAIDAGGGIIERKEGTFTVRERPEDLGALIVKVRREMEANEAALVVTGYYAAHGSVSDVVAGARACGDDDILQRLGYN